MPSGSASAGLGWPSNSHRSRKCCWQALRSVRVHPLPLGDELLRGHGVAFPPGHAVRVSGPGLTTGPTDSEHRFFSLLLGRSRSLEVRIKFRAVDTSSGNSGSTELRSGSAPRDSRNRTTAYWLLRTAAFSGVSPGQRNRSMSAPRCPASGPSMGIFSLWESLCTASPRRSDSQSPPDARPELGQGRIPSSFKGI